MQPASWAKPSTTSSEESRGRAMRSNTTSWRVVPINSSGRQGRHDRGGTSRRRRGHLPGSEQVDLAAVVFIVGKTLVNLRSGQLRETIGPHRFDRLAVLQQADDIVHGNPDFLHDGVPAPHARRVDDVAPSFRDRTPACMLRFPPRVSTGLSPSAHFVDCLAHNGLVWVSRGTFARQRSYH